MPTRARGACGGLGQDLGLDGAQLCVVRPGFLLFGVCAFNDFFFFLIRGEMLILLPEVNVACMVTVNIKIRQKKNAYTFAIISAEYAELRCIYG